MSGSFKARWPLFMTTLFCVFLLEGCRGWWFWTPGDTVENAGYHPEQPLPFSHEKHAGERQIDCQYCHASARKSMSAGVPAVSVCMGCHSVVGTELEPIKKLTEAYESKKPVEWTKVHDLPDFVRFTHERHVNSGVQCAECHGDVAKMGTVSQHAPLQMGWCLSCHVEKNARMECSTCHY